MTADDLDGFPTYVRVEVTLALARLAEVDPDALPPDLRAMYDEHRRQAEVLLAMTEDDVIELHVAACEHAGRELTVNYPPEARGAAAPRNRGRPSHPDAARETLKANTGGEGAVFTSAAAESQALARRG
jgi:hypothetical protein